MKLTLTILCLALAGCSIQTATITPPVIAAKQSQAQPEVITPAPPSYIFPPAPLPMFTRTMRWPAPDYLVDRYEIWTNNDLTMGHFAYMATVWTNQFTFGVYLDTRYFTPIAVTPDNLYSTFGNN